MTEQYPIWLTPAGLRVETIRIPWVGPSMNTIWAGIHWKKRKKYKDSGLWACHLAMRNIKPFITPVRLEFSHIMGKGRKGRQLQFYDCSNYGLTNKVVEDCLVKFKILQDDAPKFVVGVATLTPIQGPETITIVKIIEVESKPIIA